MNNELTRRAVGLSTLLELNAEDHRDDPAVSWTAPDGEVRGLTWFQYRELVLDVASGLIDLSVGIDDVVAVLAPTRIEHLAYTLAASQVHAIPVSLYPTLAPEQIDFVLSDCAPKVILVEDAATADDFAKLPWVVEHQPTVIVMDAPAGEQRAWASMVAHGAATRLAHEEVLLERMSSVHTDDTATYIYTSGTTGLPKAVVLTYGNLLWETNSLIGAGIFDYPYRALSALPMAHVAERLWSIFVAVRTHGHVYLCPDTTQLLAALQHHRPTYFMTVPRAWEKLASAAKMIMASPALADRHGELQRDREVLREVFKLRQAARHVSQALEVDAMRARRGPVRDVKVLMGLDQALAASSAAAIGPDTVEFFATLGLDILQGYGLTETSGVVTAEVPGIPGPSSVGFGIPGTEVRLGEDGEVLVRGPGNTPGYRNAPQANAELFTEDGWLRTGDLGRLDEFGRLFITGRKKEIIVNASGKNIAPQAIEFRLAGQSFVSQAVAIGDARPYLVALLTVDTERLATFVQSQGLSALTPREAIEHPVVLAEAQRLVDAANESLSRPERLKYFRLLPEDFAISTGELTPTLKIRRKAVAERHADAIEELYSNRHHDAGASPSP
ncbi:AMP-dependent synthetase/ligase [Aeromicrobium sp. HA]|uniref:AMP-dependent synthetase/ligase n=1 Tax=Aeromicrobium sp. HA TaxID=3009077 RepID=UPI0022AF0782|nr:AMP-dependent synthetase/ligase [Aeromicrobium sp. HA]